MDADLETAVARVQEARRAEDLFGFRDVTLPFAAHKEHLDKETARLVQRLEPAQYTDAEDRTAATEAKELFDGFYRDATERLQLGLYGLPEHNKARPQSATKSIRVGEHTYFIGTELTSGDRAKFYRAYLERSGKNLGQVIIKLAHSTDGNYAMRRELEHHARLHELEVPMWVHLPWVCDRFESNGRLGIVMRRIWGADLEVVRQFQPHRNGIDQRDMVWMLDRLLSVLGYVHSRGIVHGCVNPKHVMLRGIDHNAYLVGWGNAVFNPAGSGSRVETEADVFTAPEVQERGRIGPWSDIYSVGKLMIWLLGGDPETNQLPKEVEPTIREFLLKLVHPRATTRPADAWALHDEQVQLKEKLWKRKYRHFPMPEIF